MSFDQALFRWLGDGGAAAGLDVQQSEQIAGEIRYGFEQLADVRRAVTFFGSSRTSSDHPHYELVRATAAELGRAGYAVMTGGGPGLMAAANHGAKDAGALSIGLNLEFPVLEIPNEHVDVLLRFRHFFSRKVMFLRYASAYAIAPGGYGTLDELFEVLTLIQTDTVAPRPVLLIGDGEWDGLIEWLRRTAVADGRIDAAELDLLIPVENASHAAAIVGEAVRAVAQREP